MSDPVLPSTPSRRHVSSDRSTDDVRRLSVAEDTKIPNAATITINKEDHTLANMIKAFVPPSLTLFKLH